ncbi:valine--tRNA ligase isoform X1 [Acyrthosiphon pisum]|uniref:valine--tRNA ligase n=2 Tax=Acyrthosiphon pisum TaxID=7029 RepID=A0A8R1W3Y9_ACYPI|nr:valine--tRNA ligase isoform X1 [Acyrthosiphon pisum]|eukprot:XP_003240691.1 PREDICTED: valine--tRNA ligase [Acyrthosiphon pisum]
MMFIIKSNMNITLFHSKHLKKYKRIGCYCYSIDFKHGENQILPKKYEPKIVEKSKNTVLPNINSLNNNTDNRKTFSIILPPPNITGSLHLGHALTATIQDIIVRWYRMSGVDVVWVPGTDHAGIATQVVVEKKLFAEKNVNRQNIGKKAFNQEVIKWKESKISIIRNQLKNLGVTLDWNRETFTMDEKQTRAVNEAIIRLFDSKLLYRKYSLVNWCCSLQSTVSDIEIDHKEISGRTYISLPGNNKPAEFGILTDIAYKFHNSDQEIIVSTTRPETLLGDVAVAVNPDDVRYKGLNNVKLWHPFRKCTIPLIYDHSVDKHFGTGAVKLTPAHDVFDFELAAKHDLPIINVIDESGNINCEYDEFNGLPRYEARTAIIQKLKEMNLLRDSKEHKMSIPICSRTGDIIEHLPKLQWFINCKEMAQKASESLRNGKLIIEPTHYHNQWFLWLDNSKDWCVSRQLWWGHRLPLFETKYGWISAHNTDEAIKKIGAKIKLSEKEMATLDIRQEEDVLDTWFSSALLPFSSFGWPDETEDLKKYYPLSVMETGHDILTFWIARMVMLGTFLTGSLPFKNVILHGMICDNHGRKMSKSLGNVVDPEDIINGISLDDLQNKVKANAKLGTISYDELEKALVRQKKLFPDGIKESGTDALRLTLVSQNIKNQVIHFDVNECYQNRMFCNKIWQATRFVLMWAKEKKVHDYISPTPSNMIQFWILSRLGDCVHNINNSFQNYDIYIATTKLRQFFYYEFCDVFLETCKPIFEHGTDEEIQTTCKVLLYVLDTSLRLMNPLMPFLSETLYCALPGKNNTPVAYTKFPEPIEYTRWLNEQIDADMRTVRDIVTAIRRIRSINNFSKDQSEIILHSKCHKLLHKYEDIIQHLSGSNLCFVEENSNLKLNSISDIVGDHTEIHLLLKGGSLEYKKYYSILNSRRQRLQKQVMKMEKSLSLSKTFKNSSDDSRVARADKMHSLMEEINRISMYMKTIKDKELVAD